MTYCVGMLVKDGLVMMADTRTNAGIDNISIYRKLHILADRPDRLIVALTAGNLSVTQLVLSMLAEGMPPLAEGDPSRRIGDMPSMFRAAQLVGEAVAHAREDVRAALEAEKVSAGISMLVGGRVGPGPLKLYLIYAEGNFIECQVDQPFLQIGETKYGKPILDRALTFDTPIDEAVKVGLISFDSTIRSNLAVGRPIDLIVIPVDHEAKVTQRRIASDDPYFNDLSARWSMLLNESRATIPAPPFLHEV
jgi:putative proteasome-type protease